MAVPLLQSDRIVLRSLSENDYPEIYALRSNASVNTFLNRKPCASITEAKEFIAIILENSNQGDSYYWAIASLEDNSLLGTICIYAISEQDRSCQIGYELMPQQQKKGYVTEALKLVLLWIQQKLPIKTVIAETHKENTSSIQVLLQHDFQLKAVDSGSKIVTYIKNML